MIIVENEETDIFNKAYVAACSQIKAIEQFSTPPPSGESHQSQTEPATPAVIFSQ